MRYFPSLVLLCSVYLITMIFGLNTAAFILPLMYPPPGVEQVIAPVVEDPQDIKSSFQIFGYILLMTAVILLLLKIGWGVAINIILFFSFLAGTFLTSAAFFGDFGWIFTALLIILILWKRDNLVLSNLVLVFTISGIGAILGASLGVLPVITLLVLLAVYDYVSVFITKHMVALAKGTKGKFNLMFIVPVGDRTMGLGTGDVTLPLTFAVSVFREYGAGYAIPTAFGGLLGLVWMFYYMLNEENVTLPALPPIVAGLLIGYGLCSLILGGFIS